MCVCSFDGTVSKTKIPDQKRCKGWMEIYWIKKNGFDSCNIYH